MTNFQKLKHEARRAEQRSDWGRAIDLYQRALDADEDMADLSLYNRIGDLHLRLAQNEAAVECYERAVDRYADNGMHTSAIALCNKILRIAPGRVSAYRRLGTLHARSGLVAEGRSNTLTFVDQALDSDESADAATAVDAFVELTGDEEIRLRFAERLEAAGDRAAAAEQLRVVYRQRRKRGSDASELRERLEALAPGGAEEESEIAEAKPTIGPPVRLAALVADHVDTGGATFEAEPSRTVSQAVSGRDPVLDGLRRDVAAFREAVEDDLEGGDATVRYDLGVELMTIGLLEEAIEEFHAAVADPSLMEAANARIGECLALRTSGAALDLRRGARAVAQATEARTPPIPAADSDEADTDAVAVAAAADAVPHEVTDELAEPDSASPTDAEVEADAEQAGSEDEEEHEDELQGHFFRARLAQYRIRQAEERHMTDHAAHFDLGSAYVGMGLFQEALRELGVALGGPRPVSGRAARAMARLAIDHDAPHDVALDILERLAASEAGSTAEGLAARLAATWGAEHPGAARLAELAGALSDAVRDLPALEEMFPVMSDAADEDGTPAPVTPPPAAAAPSATADPETTEMATPGPEAADPADAVIERAATLEADGRIEEAESELRLGFARLQEAGRTRQARQVFDRLVRLRPDDVELHEQRVELALMVNDRPGLVEAYLGLGACLQRLDRPLRARVAFGRVLDVEPDDETARAAIDQIDRMEVAREQAVEPRAESADEAEVDALLENLAGVDADPDPVEAGDASDGGNEPSGDDATDATARSHYELGLAFRQMGMWEEAARELHAALDGVTDRLPVLEALSECLVRAGHTERAVELLRGALRSDEDEAQVVPLYWFGLALQAEGNDGDARDVFARIEAVQPGYRDTSERLSELSL